MLPSFAAALEKYAKAERLSVSPKDRVAWKARLAQAKVPEGDTPSVGRDKQGFYVYTHRSRSSSYPTPGAIPLAKIRFVGSTG